MLFFVTILLASLPIQPQIATSAAADQIAFSSVLNLSDPEKKLEALKAFRAQYPKSSKVSRAQDLILEVLLKNFPDRGSEIKYQVDLMLKEEVDTLSRAYAYDSIARDLAEGGVLIPFAEKLEGKSQKLFTRKNYKAMTNKALVSANRPPVSDAGLEHYYSVVRSALSTTTGLIYSKQGKNKEALQSLREAYSNNPDNSAAAALLGTLTAKEGRTEEALRYLIRARLTGELNQDQEAELERLYRTSTARASLPLDKYLDSQYASIFPLPFKVSKYKPEQQSSGRVVLAELFTGSGCGPCAGADLAMEGDLERYTRDQLVMIALDVHIPKPDPLANPASLERFAFYQGKNAPTLAVDGKTQIGGGDRARAQERFEKNNKLFDEALKAAPEAKIQLTVERDTDCVRVHALTSDIQSSDKTLRLQIALVENRVRYSGENGIRSHLMVVRSMAPANGFSVEAGKASSVDYIFNVPKISSELKDYLDHFEQSNDRFGPIHFIQKMDTIDSGDLSVVAFIQDSTTKHVLQTAYMPVVSAP